MQLSYYRIHGKNFTSTSGMRVSQSSVNSLVGRVGIFAGVERETGRNYRKDAAVQFTYRYSF
jgi:outer membrane autotransporter protein